jgi:hypothetical protein
MIPAGDVITVALGDNLKALVSLQNPSLAFFMLL